MASHEKNIWYSSPLNFFWEELYKKQKSFTPNYSNEQVFQTLRQNLLTSPLAPGESAESRELIMSGLELWKQDSDGELLHIYFLDRTLRDFLGNTSLSDLDGLREYLYRIGKSNDVIYLTTKEMVNCIVFTFGLHIPFEKNGYTFSLSLFEDTSIELYFSHGRQNGRLSDKLYSDLNRKRDSKSIEFSEMFRLAINTIAYMKCFPECVAEGVPSMTFTNAEVVSKRNINFGITEKITDPKGTPNSKIPHFRKGHFRMLRSDYYSNKKGQLIYINETMVKGSAKTISKSERAEELSKRSRKKINN